MIINENTKEKISNSKTVYSIMQKILDSRSKEEKHKEYFYILGLDSQNRVLVVDLITIGTVNACVPFVREAFRLAILKNCVSIIAVHNHPSGAIQPSQGDHVFTATLKKAGEVLGIKLLDHIIIGESFYSFADSEIL